MIVRRAFGGSGWKREHPSEDVRVIFELAPRYLEEMIADLVNVSKNDFKISECYDIWACARLQERLP